MTDMAVHPTPDFNAIWSSQQFVTNNQLIDTPVVKGFDALMNSIVERCGAFLDAATERLKESGQTGACFDRANFTFEPKDITPEAPVIPRSERISPPERTPTLAPELVASAREATRSMSSMSVQMADMGDNHNVVAYLGVNAMGPQSMQMGGVG